MAKVEIKKLTNVIFDQLDGMVKRANLVPGYLNRVIYPKYQAAQRKRWETENSGDDFAGGRWASLDPVYSSYKRRKYAGYPGGGTKLLIRTKSLFDSIVGPSQFHEKIVDERSIHISTSIPYAEFVDEKRTFTSFSVPFRSELYDGLADYLFKGIVKGGF